MSRQLWSVFHYSEDKSGRTVNGLKNRHNIQGKTAGTLKIDDLVYYIQNMVNDLAKRSKQTEKQGMDWQVIKHLQKEPGSAAKLYDNL